MFAPSLDLEGLEVGLPPTETDSMVNEVGTLVKIRRFGANEITVSWENELTRSRYERDDA